MTFLRVPFILNSYCANNSLPKYFLLLLKEMIVVYSEAAVVIKNIVVTDLTLACGKAAPFK